MADSFFNQRTASGMRVHARNAEMEGVPAAKAPAPQSRLAEPSRPKPASVEEKPAKAQPAARASATVPARTSAPSSSRSAALTSSSISFGDAIGKLRRDAQRQSTEGMLGTSSLLSRSPLLFDSAPDEDESEEQDQKADAYTTKLKKLRAEGQAEQADQHFAMTKPAEKSPEAAAQPAALVGQKPASPKVKSTAKTGGAEMDLQEEIHYYGPGKQVNLYPPPNTPVKYSR